MVRWLSFPSIPCRDLANVWILGTHRLACGDATSKADVDRLLKGTRPHLMVTDPPYGVDYDPRWRHETKVNQFTASVRAVGQVLNDERAEWSEAWKLFPGDVCYAWHASLRVIPAATGLLKAGFELRAHIVWAKQQASISRGDYHWQHEPCWYAVRKGRPSHWNGDRKQKTIWQIASINPLGGGGRGMDIKLGHGTQKPIETMRLPIVNSSAPGDSVYDPFVGSGTTIMAAETVGRRCYAMDVDPSYVDVCIRRWQDYAKREAALEGDGRTFAAVSRAKARAVPPAQPKRKAAPAGMRRRFSTALTRRADQPAR